MRPLSILLPLLLWLLPASAQDHFPDGTPLDGWFYEAAAPLAESLPRFEVTDHGVLRDSTQLQTEALQRVIDHAFEQGGGVVVIPQGTFLSGALFFRPGTHLHLEAGGRLKGSDFVGDFPLVETRIEGQSRRYFSALINADSLAGFTITGRGVIDGNGERYWRSFWLRRAFNPECTNLDEMRPRLLYLSHCTDLFIEGVTLQNSPFWSCHLYRSERVRIQNVTILAPAEPVRAPSSDAIDIDACQKVHIKDCYMSVNDDAIALKGGKGPYADRDPKNGPNHEILIEDCRFGYCHSALTCGSEAIHCRNIWMRRCRVEGADRLLWLKMRPDTPQCYEYIRLEEIEGSARSMLYIHPWRQFFDLGDREDLPLSYGSNISFRAIDFRCKKLFDVSHDPQQYLLSGFTFEEFRVEAEEGLLLDLE